MLRKHLCKGLRRERASLHLKEMEDNQHGCVLVRDKANSLFRYHCSQCTY